MVTYIDWKNYYSVGDPSLDIEHKEVVELINELYAAMGSGTENRATKVVLERLVQYTLNHFKHEEEVMLETGYPDFEAHKALHDRMRQRTLDLRTHLSLVTGRDVLHMLKEWWLEHMQSEDKKYSPYLQQIATRP